MSTKMRAVAIAGGAGMCLGTATWAWTRQLLNEQADATDVLERRFEQRAGVSAKSLIESKSPRKRCVVVGSGVVGLTSAYWLSRASNDFDIIVVDKNMKSALGCSYQNGGVVNVEAIHPVNSYFSIPRTLIASIRNFITGSDTNTVVSWRALLEPNLAKWLFYFYQNTAEEKIVANSAHMMHLGNMTGPLFAEVARDLRLGASHNYIPTPGLCLFHSAAGQTPVEWIKAKHARFGAVHRKNYISGHQLAVVQAESGLLGLAEQHYNLGVVEPNNFTINTRHFCSSIEAQLRASTESTRFCYGRTVTEVVTDEEKKTVLAVVLDNGEKIEADVVVLAAGYETAYMLQKLGLQVPLMAVKAYSLHIDKALGLVGPLKYATHLDAGVACLVTPYRESEPQNVRVTGCRDLDGFNNIVHPNRIAALARAAESFACTQIDVQADGVSVWAGVMAVSPDDFPVVGATSKYSNLYINTGHGFRGTNWSMASAAVLAAGIMGSSSINCLGMQKSQLWAMSKKMSPSRFGI